MVYRHAIGPLSVSSSHHQKKHLLKAKKSTQRIDDPKKGFWVIPTDANYLQQGGRSHNSVLFCMTPVPEGADHFDITFRQYRSDNDYIGYIIGAQEMELYPGIEFGYMTQIPGTDSTVNDGYISGAFGEKTVLGVAHMDSWAEHRIEVRNVCSELFHRH